MSFFKWSQKLDVGVHLMNEEHKTLIGIMNRLHERNAAGADRIELGRIIDELARATVKHFSDEEAYMASVNYEDLEKHKIIHKQLLEQFGRQKERFEHGDGKVAQEFFSFLSLWLSAHIQGIDMKYGGAAKGVKSA